MTDILVVNNFNKSMAETFTAQGGMALLVLT